MNKIRVQFGVLSIMILSAAFCRMVPHMLNFSPLCAIGLFGAAHFTQKWKAFLVPLLATWLSDLFINNVLYASYNPVFVWFYSGFYWQYGAYVLVILLGIGLFKNNITLPKLVGSAIASSVLFFLISNFGSWLNNPIYTKDLAGLLTCYAAGVPFYQGTLLGDLFYSTILFGAYYVLQHKVSILKLAHIRYALK